MARKKSADLEQTGKVRTDLPVDSLVGLGCLAGKFATDENRKVGRTGKKDIRNVVRKDIDSIILQNKVPIAYNK